MKQDAVALSLVYYRDYQRKSQLISGFLPTLNVKGFVVRNHVLVIVEHGICG